MIEVERISVRTKRNATSMPSSHFLGEKSSMFEEERKSFRGTRYQETTKRKSGAIQWNWTKTAKNQVTWNDVEDASLNIVSPEVLLPAYNYHEDRKSYWCTKDFATTFVGTCSIRSHRWDRRDYSTPSTVTEWYKWEAQWHRAACIWKMSVRFTAWPSIEVLPQIMINVMVENKFPTWESFVFRFWYEISKCSE